MQMISFQPAKMKHAVENEPWRCKLRIGGHAILMAGVSSFFQHYFDNLVYRSGQYQVAALGGKLQFHDYQDMEQWGAYAWSLKNTLDVMNDKPLKELKQIQEDWKTGSYKDLGVTKWTNPNGDPFDNKGYFTQKQRFYDDYQNTFNKYWAEAAARNPIERDALRYEQWVEMHTDVIWFDTAACWKDSFIGDVNLATISPTAPFLATDPTKTYATVNPASDYLPSYNGKDLDGNTFGARWNGWFTGAQYSTVSPKTNWDNVKTYSELTAPKDAAAPYQQNWERSMVTSPASGSQVEAARQVNTYRANAWDTDLTVSGIRWNDIELSKDLY